MGIYEKLKSLSNEAKVAAGMVLLSAALLTGYVASKHQAPVLVLSNSDVYVQLDQTPCGIPFLADTIPPELKDKVHGGYGKVLASGETVKFCWVKSSDLPDGKPGLIFFVTEDGASGAAKESDFTVKK